MRRTVSLVLVAVGVLLLALAPLMRWYVYPRVAVVPNEVTDRVSEGEGLVILDVGAVAAGEPDINVTTDIRSVRKIIPDPEASTDDVAVWETTVTNVDLNLLDQGATAEDAVRSAYADRVAFDRHTAEGVAGYDQFYSSTGREDDREYLDHEGHYFKLPFGTEKKDYQWWDASTRATSPMVYQDEEDIDGLTVYRFEQRIEPTVIAQIEVPGSLLGATEPSVEADRVYSNVRTIWVEPLTGGVVKGQEEQDSYLEYQGTRGPTVTLGTLTYTDDQVAELVDKLGDDASQLRLVHTTVPLLGLVIGAVLVIVGLLVLRTGDAGRRAAVADGNGLDMLVADDEDPRTRRRPDE